MPKIIMKTPESTRERDLEHKLRNILALELGFNEVYNYSFMSDDERQKLNAKEERVVKVKNPISPEQSFLRTSLIPGILRNIVKNQNNFAEMKLFELGRVYFNVKGLNSRGEKLPEEAKKICGALVFLDKEEVVFRRARGLLESFFARLGLGDCTHFTPLVAGSAIWQRGGTTNIEVNKKVVGQAGFINKKMALAFGLKSIPLLFNLDFANLVDALIEKSQYKPLPRFPAIDLDLSIVIDQKIYWQEIEDLIKSLKNDIIKEVKLFDVYRGKNMPENKRSLAFRIIYRSDDKTLKLEEAKEVQGKVIGLLEEKFGAEVRDK